MVRLRLLDVEGGVLVESSVGSLDLRVAVGSSLDVEGEVLVDSAGGSLDLRATVGSSRGLLDVEEAVLVGSGVGSLGFSGWEAVASVRATGEVEIASAMSGAVVVDLDVAVAAGYFGEASASSVHENPATGGVAVTVGGGPLPVLAVTWLDDGFDIAVD